MNTMKAEAEHPPPWILARRMRENEFYRWHHFDHWSSLLICPIAERWTTSLLFQKIDCVSLNAMNAMFPELLANIKTRGVYKPAREPGRQGRGKGKGNKTSATAARQYIYSSLPSDAHIRLIYIIPGVDGLIRIRFSTVALPDAPPFETLSYVWGSPLDTRFIDIQGESLAVRQNLHNALHTLRSNHVERCFWIDALSINQSDLGEVSKQVAIMPQLYASSWRTTVWLQAGAKLSAETMELLKTMTKSGEEVQTAIAVYKEESWRELGRLYFDPWLYRVWIIQEIAMAQDVLVLLNGEPWPWDILIQAATVALTQAQALKFQTIFDPESLLRLETIRAAFISEGPAPILQALALGRRSLATLGVDKVYGLLGLSAEGFRVDYEEKTESVYLRLARAVVALGGTMTLLNQVDDHIFRVHHSLPSWVPDWQAHPGVRPLLETSAAAEWNASNDSAVYAGLSAGDGQLHVHGFVLDALDRIGNLFFEDAPLSGSFRGGCGAGSQSKTRADYRLGQVFGRVTQWRALAMRHGTMFATEEARYNAYVATLTAGNVLPQGDSQHQQGVAETRGYELWCKVWTLTSQINFDLDRIVSAYGTFSADEMTQAAGFMRLHIQAAWMRRLYTTHQGMIGLCPSSARRGDLLVIIHGGKTPYIIRKRKDGHFRFVGECYAHGFMHGEARAWKTGDLKVEEFILQ
ncbi:heterokaryon incompatibility protein-domain-containing protein [Astrocystis sublimbata]|nr:heterokaryon incompatibility protein-domain-containing protein [Astrocystis sublimbata]